jgi:heme-degrading monooxygenase HmoA
MSVVEIAQLRAVTGREDEFERALPRALGVISRDPGCRGTSSYRCIERANEFTLMIVWDSVEAHQAFRASEDFPRYRGELAGVLDAVTGYAHYREIKKP